MTKHLALKITLSVVAMLAALYGIYSSAHISTLPFGFNIEDSHTLSVHRLEGIALPSPIEDGDLIVLGRQDATARELLVARAFARNLPPDKTYDLILTRGTGEFTARVSTIASPKSVEELAFVAMDAIYLALLLVMALLLLWRGRDRAAFALALYCLGYLVGNAFGTVPSDGVVGVAAIIVANASFLTSRVGFYLMSESLVAQTIGVQARVWFRVLFAGVLTFGVVQQFFGPVLFAMGNAALSNPALSLPFSWSYIIPVALLYHGLRDAIETQRIKMRWVIACGLILTGTVTVINAVPFGFYLVNTIAQVGILLTTVGLVYALLRHRLVSFSVFIDRALVYTSVTTLVIGVLAAANTVTLRLALPPGAGIVLQIVVPFALGIVLGRVRYYMDLLVERVFFRSRYQSGQMLRRFVRQCGQFSEADRLFTEASSTVMRSTGAPAVAFYGDVGGAYEQLSARGDGRFPVSLGYDDVAAVGLRAEQSPIVLAHYDSALGSDGMLFPMRVLGIGHGFMAITYPPGGQYSSEEKALLAEVADATGAAWRILKARQSDALIDALASEQGSLDELRKRARALRPATTR